MSDIYSDVGCTVGLNITILRPAPPRGDCIHIQCTPRARMYIWSLFVALFSGGEDFVQEAAVHLGAKLRLLGDVMESSFQQPPSQKF